MDDLIRVAMAVIMMAGFPVLFYGAFVGIRVFQRRMEGKTVSPDMMRELEDLRNRVAEMEQVQERLAEVEERLDFAERLLAREKNAAQIQGDR